MKFLLDRRTIFKKATNRLCTQVRPYFFDMGRLLRLSILTWKLMLRAVSFRRICLQTMEARPLSGIWPPVLVSGVGQGVTGRSLRVRLSIQCVAHRILDVDL